MKLSEYLIWKNIRPYKFAKVAGVSKNTVYFINRHGYAPKGTMLYTLQGIIRASGESVEMKDLVNGD